MMEEYLSNNKEIFSRIYFQYPVSFRIRRPQHLAQNIQYFSAQKPICFLGGNSLEDIKGPQMDMCISE